MNKHAHTTEKNLIERPPIVVVLGHVDHGKSTLLDYIRKTNTTEAEAGGITQHISAYEVIHTTNEGTERRITFLDTPGHKAFSKMRERGANLADVAILVVSGEDGVKEQTLEVLQTLKESKIPYVVAITKIDKPNANTEKIKQNLAEHEIFIEGYGGDIPAVPVSAKTGAGVSDLLDMVLLVAGMKELKGNPQAPAEGVVVESHISSREGVSATIIITNGTLKLGMYVTAENAYAPVRRIDAFLNHATREATFSSPVILTGFDTAPNVGASLHSFENKKEALSHIKNNVDNHSSLHFSDTHITRNRDEAGIPRSKENFFLPLVIKADATGSLEALENEIAKLEKEGAPIKIVHKGVGPIEEGDIKAASSGTRALIIGFHTTISKTAERVALQQDIAIKTFDVIYKLTEWLAEEIKKKTPKVTVEEKVGSAKILKIFNTAKGKQVVGGKVLDGEITAHGKIKIIRRGNEISDGIIEELQQQKKRVHAVKTGFEFGASVAAKYDIAAGDTIEAFALVEK